jgi:hypothetical protein
MGAESLKESPNSRVPDLETGRVKKKTLAISLYNKAIDNKRFCSCPISTGNDTS